MGSGATRANFWLRVVRPPFAEQHDDNVCQCFPTFLGIPTRFSQPSSRCVNVFEEKRLGIGERSRVTACGHRARWAYCLNLVNKKDPSCGTTDGGRHAAWSNGMFSSCPVLSTVVGPTLRSSTRSTMNSWRAVEGEDDAPMHPKKSWQKQAVSCVGGFPDCVCLVFVDRTRVELFGISAAALSHRRFAPLFPRSGSRVVFFLTRNKG